MPDAGYFGVGNGLIHLSNISCIGSEGRLTDCKTSLIGQQASCSHAEDVAVACQGAYTDNN